MSVTYTTTISIAFGNYRGLVLADSPSVYWRFGAPDPGEDLSGHGLGGEPIGSPTAGEPGATPDGNASYNFDGVGAYVRTDDPDNLLNCYQTAFSAECLVKFTSSSAAAIMGHAAQTTKKGWILQVDTGGKLRFIGTSTGGAAIFDITTTGAYNDGNWHHVVATWDYTTTANHVILYVDGVSVKTGTASAGDIEQNAATIFRVATYGDASTLFFAGHLDEIAVYRSALTATQVAAHYRASVWVDVTTDVRQANGISIRYGMSDGRPQTHLATSGEAQFVLDNSTGNSAGLAGYYSPHHANCRSGFRQGILTRIVYTYNSVSYYKFVGRLIDIRPSPGTHLDRGTICLAADYMDDLARANLLALPVELNKTFDQSLTTVVNAMPTQPIAMDFATGIRTFPYTFLGGQGGALNGLQEAQRLTTSEWGYAYIKGNTTTGGVFRAENRHTRLLHITSDWTLANDMSEQSISGSASLEVPSSLNDIINRAIARLHPRRVDTSAVVLYSSETAGDANAASITPQDTITINASYRDPNQTISVATARVSGTSMVDPVATTDYTANTAADGSGTDLTAVLTVTADFGSTGATIAITNTDMTQTAYLTKLQLRGIGLYDYEETTVFSDDAASQNLYGLIQADVDITYEPDINQAQSIADSIRFTWANPFGYATSTSFIANSSATRMAMGLGAEIGDRVTVSETQTGISGDFFINSVELIQTTEILGVTWKLAPADAATYWILEQSGYSELDTTTILAPL